MRMMKYALRLSVLAILIPFALLAGKTPRTTGPTLNASACNVGSTQPCILITGSGYGVSKTVTIEVDGGATSESFTAPANSSGQIALYISVAFPPGIYTVTSFQGSKLMATTSFDVP